MGEYTGVEIRLHSWYLLIEVQNNENFQYGRMGKGL